jgi:hypothetical protein
MRNPAVHSTVTIACVMMLVACADRAPTMPHLTPPAELSASVSAPSITSLGPVLGQAVNDAGAVVGAKGSDVYVWDQTAGAKLVAVGGTVWDIAGDGNSIGGKNAAGNPLLWSRGVVWSEIALPHLGFGGAVRAIASDGAGAPGIMTGNVWGAGATKTPGVWTRCAGETNCVNGWHLRTLDLVAPVTEGWGQDINASGQVVGMEGTGCCRAMFWDENGMMQVLPPLTSGAAAAAWSINDAGTVIVGQSSDRAVAWVRSSPTSAFGPPTAIAPKTSGCGSGGGSIAFAVMPDLVTSGTIVGQDCGLPVAWRVTVSGNSLTLVQRAGLPSAVKSMKGNAPAINRSTSARHGATGQAGGTGVFWAF